MTDVWDDLTVADRIPRDQWGRPIIPPAKGGKPVAYTRVSTLSESLDDRFRLEMWKGRQTTIGYILRPDLLRLAAAKRHDRDALDGIVKEAIKAAGSEAAANDGTALHALIEQDLTGGDISHASPELRADVQAMRDCLDRHSFKVVHVERFCVCETLKCAGTPDLIIERDGELYVGDWKSGEGAVEFGLPRIAIQESVYAHSETFYTPTTGHEPMPRLNQSRAYVFHVPFGSGTCNLYEVNIAEGWEAAKTAKWVREYRNRKDLGRSVTDAADTLGFRREWVAQRVRALPQGAVDMLARMVADHGNLPRVSVSADAHLDDWAELLDLVEAEHEVPFGTRDPSKPTNRKRRQ